MDSIVVALYILTCPPEIPIDMCDKRNAVQVEVLARGTELICGGTGYTWQTHAAAPQATAAGGGETIRTVCRRVHRNVAQNK